MNSFKEYRKIRESIDESDVLHKLIDLAWSNYEDETLKFLSRLAKQNDSIKSELANLKKDSVPPEVDNKEPAKPIADFGF